MATEAQKKASANYAKKMTKCVILHSIRKQMQIFLKSLIRLIQKWDTSKSLLEKILRNQKVTRVFKLWLFSYQKSLRISY